MGRFWLVAALAGLAAAGHISAQSTPQSTPWTFHWHKGQVLTFRVEHVTKVAEVVTGNKVETGSKLNLVKRWEVDDVDAAGIATVRLSLSAMRNEQKRPNGEVMVYDSADPDKSTPSFREQMAKYVGKTLAILRVDGLGKVIEVVQGSAAQYESDPPFVLRLPSQAPRAGQSWQRLYHITLEPPFGTGEKYPSMQKYQVISSAGGLATLHMATELKMPETGPERLPLLQKQPEGEMVFNIEAGHLQSANLRIEKELQGHQGEGSSYHFTSTYREEFVDGN